MGLGSASGKVGMGLSVKWVEGTVLSFHGRFDPEEVKGFISESKELKEDENGITVSDRTPYCLCDSLNPLFTVGHKTAVSIPC